MNGGAETEHDQAARWVARMDAPGWRAEDEAALNEWLDGAPSRRGLLLQMQAAWLALDPPSVADRRHEERSPPRTRRWLLGTFGTAAAAAVAGTLWANAPAYYDTRVGEIRRVALADGSVVAINTASALEVRLGKQSRRIELDRGEAWFQVAKNPARPFVVTAGNANVMAVGTAFSVRRREQGAEILVTEGVVKAWGAGGTPVSLRAGERAFIATDASVRKHVNTVSTIDQALAWRSGRIDLIGETLEYAIGEFNRYNTRKLVLVDPALGREQLDGVFRIEDVEGFARAVARALGVRIDVSHADEIRIG